MVQGSLLLRSILEKISQVQAQGLKALLVFDLDSTLFDVSPRLQRILHDFANDPDNQKRFPESTEILKTIETHKSDWGIRNSLIRAGLDKHSGEFHQALKDHWLENFFTSEYLHYDQPYAGAAEFVQKVARAGSEIVYLSGRDRPRMEKGTLEVLKKWNFPIDNTQARLALKPERGLNDADFKRDWFLDIPHDAFGQIWFFENEPLNVNAIRNHFDHIDIIFFESTHAGKADPPVDLPKIFHFLMDDDLP
jgi:hypothetical protein